MSVASNTARTCADGTRRRGRPRDVRVDAAVLEATLDLIVESGVANLSMDQVAHRAGVGKATIYRRWDNKEAMLLDALRSVRHPLDLIDSGTLRGDLERYFDQLIVRYRTSKLSDVVPHLLEASFYDASLRVELELYMRERQKPLRDILERGAERGELGRFSSAGDIDLLVSAFLGPFVYRNMISHEPLDDDLVDRLLDLMLPLDGSTPVDTDEELTDGTGAGATSDASAG